MKVGNWIAPHYTLPMDYIMPFFGYIALMIRILSGSPQN